MMQKRQSKTSKQSQHVWAAALFVVFLIGLVVWMASSSDSEARPKVDPVDEADMDQLAAGAFSSVSVDLNEARIDPFLWSSLSLEIKQGLVMWLSRYFDAKGSTARVTILSDRNDTKLATYSSWSGVTILR